MVSTMVANGATLPPDGEDGPVRVEDAQLAEVLMLRCAHWYEVRLDHEWKHEGHISKTY